MRRGIVGVLFAAAASVSLLAGGGPGPRAQQRGASQAPTFRSGVEVVTVDVGVIDKKGLPLRGLTTDDFSVTVGGQPRRVVTAEFLEQEAGHAAAPEGPASGTVSTNEGSGVGRLFAFIVDQSTLDLDGGRRAATAAGSFLSQLTFADRSAVIVMPTGPSVAFTWAHDRVRSVLERVVGMGRPMSDWESGSLAEARDIANHNTYALRTVGERACGSMASQAGAGASPASASPTPTGGSAPQTGGGAAPTGGSGGSGAAPAPTPSASGGGAGSSLGAGGLDMLAGRDCLRNLQTQAEMAWRSTELNSLASISALRAALQELGQVPGDKTAVLISGGWPLDERDEISLLSQVAAEAAAARV
ncbi:MAG: hypothetical protein ACM3H9_02225, partial [Rhodospirillaceae bacterium]